MPGCPGRVALVYNRAPGSGVSTVLSKFVGQFTRPLRRLTESERNRELRWKDDVPSGWALDMGKPTMSHQVMEYFYDKVQYFASQRPGRSHDYEKYRSGWVTPAERAYGQDYQSLPFHRAQLARDRGTPQRRGLSMQADGIGVPLESLEETRSRHNPTEER